MIQIQHTLRQDTTQTRNQPREGSRWRDGWAGPPVYAHFFPCNGCRICRLNFMVIKSILGMHVSHRFTVSRFVSVFWDARTVFVQVNTGNHLLGFLPMGFPSLGSSRTYTRMIRMAENITSVQLLIYAYGELLSRSYVTNVYKFRNGRWVLTTYAIPIDDWLGYDSPLTVFYQACYWYRYWLILSLLHWCPTRCYSTQLRKSTPRLHKKQKCLQFEVASLLCFASQSFGLYFHGRSLV